MRKAIAAGLSFVLSSFLCICNAVAAPILWVDDASGLLGRVDVATGAVTVVGNMGVVMTDIAFDPAGNLYGITFNSLYSINKTTAAVSLIGSFGPTLNSLVFSSGGTLYAASNSLYTLNKTTGAATLIGTGGGYNSSGDLAFSGGNLYLTSTTPAADTLFRLSTTTGVGTAVGAMGSGAFFGLASPDNAALLGVAGTNIYSVNPVTGASTLLIGYGGKGLGVANGSAFLSEAGAPEPETVALLGLGLMALVMTRRKRA